MRPEHKQPLQIPEISGNAAILSGPQNPKVGTFPELVTVMCPYRPSFDDDTMRLQAGMTCRLVLTASQGWSNLKEPGYLEVHAVLLHRACS